MCNTFRKANSTFLPGASGKNTSDSGSPPHQKIPEPKQQDLTKLKPWSKVDPKFPQHLSACKMPRDLIRKPHPIFGHIRLPRANGSHKPYPRSLNECTQSISHKEPQRFTLEVASFKDNLPINMEPQRVGEICALPKNDAKTWWGDNSSEDNFLASRDRLGSSSEAHLRGCPFRPAVAFPDQQNLPYAG